MDVAHLPTHKRVLEILKAAGKEFGADGAGRMGAALSYYSIFSLVPLLFLALAIAGYLFSDDEVLQNMLTDVAEIAGEEAKDFIAGLTSAASRQASGALWIGATLSAYSASGIFQQVQGVLAVIFHVADEHRRTGPVGWLIRRGVALLSALVFAVLALTPIVAVAAVGWILELAFIRDVAWLVTVVQLGLPVAALLVLMLVVGVSYQLLTPVDITWRAAVRGGAATAVAGLIAALLVGTYLRTAGTTGTLGALGGLAILLVFSNIIWLVYLFGAEVTKAYSDYLFHGDVVQPSARERGVVPGRTVASEGAGHAGVLAFVAGMLIGWIGRRRRSTR